MENNQERKIVELDAILKSDEFLNGKKDSLTFAIGQTREGEILCGDFSQCRHVLIGGSTYSGNGELLCSMISSLIQKYSPNELKLILIDLKRVEFVIFNGLPHLLTGEILKDPIQTINAFNWAIREMERRYELFAQRTRSGVATRTIDEYNLSCENEGEKLAKVVLVVEEIADMMSLAKNEFEERVQRLTQKSRAAGIYLVLATQRPTTTVITGVIKSCMPTRIAFRTPLALDSVVILDQEGAENLGGKGDGILKCDWSSECIRFQCAYVSSLQCKEIVEATKAKYPLSVDLEAVEYINRAEE